MIKKLDDINELNVLEFGMDITNLKKLYNNDIPIVSTLAISNELFIEYKESIGQNLREIESICADVSNEFESVKCLNINASLFQENYGIPSFNKIKNTPKALKDKILEIYNSWFDWKAKAHRITYSIQDENTYPAIYFQPYRENVNSFVTRCPRSGKITNPNNLNNIHNTIKEVNNILEQLFFKIEQAVKCPTKLYYTNFENPEIINVEPETMTLLAKWLALNDLCGKGVITKEEYVALLEPNMIYERNGIKPISETNKNITKINGLPASHGVSIGYLVFDISDIEEYKESNAILCCIDGSPEMLNKLTLSIGAISCRGGMTSHLAVVARGIGIPAVTSAPFIIDYKKKELLIGNEIFPEKSNIIVDGNKGEIFISREKLYTESNYKANSSYEDLKTSFLIIKSLTSTENFKNYSIEFQMKIAQLLSAFNKIDFKI